MNSNLDMQIKEEALQENIKYLERHGYELKEANSALEKKKLVTSLEDINQKMYDSAVDGFIATKIAESSASWSKKENQQFYYDVVEKYEETEITEYEPEELVNYLVNTIKCVRPNYDKNTIVNLAICFTQGFLTVLSGKPGCGKT